MQVLVQLGEVVGHHMEEGFGSEGVDLVFVDQSLLARHYTDLKYTRMKAIHDKTVYFTLFIDIGTRQILVILKWFICLFSISL